MINCLLSNLNSGLIADVVCVVFIAIFGLISLSKGFTKQVLGLITGIGSIVLACFFCDDLVKLLDGWWGIQGKFAGVIAKAFGDNEILNAELNAENITKAVQALHLPSFIADAAIKNLGTATYPSIAAYLSNMFAGHILTACSFIVIFIVAKLLLAIVKKLVSALVTLPVIHGLDRVLGLVLGLAKGFLLLYIVIYLIGIIPPSVTFMNVVKDAINNSTIGSFMLNKNLFAMIMNWATAAVESLK